MSVDGNIIDSTTHVATINPNHLLTMGDIGSVLWAIPAVKTGAIRLIGVFGAIFNDF